MSALPANVVDFKLPKRKPKIIEKAAPPDQRAVAVLPIRALVDKQLTDGTFRILGLLCSYCNRAGLTWVSQARLADDMKVSRQAITKHIGKLVAAGYVEVSKKGFKGEKPNTLRVIFDPSIKTEDAVAITSSLEDTRPPEMIRADKKAAERPQERLADDGLPEMSEEQAAANRERLREMLSNWGNTNFRTHQPQKLGDLMPRAKKQLHRQPNTVANEEDLHRQPQPVDNSLHRQPHRQPNRVAQNTEEHIKDSVYKVFKKKFKDCSKQPELIEVMLECMSESQAIELLDEVEARYKSEGLNLPSMPTVINDMILMHSGRHL